MRVHFALFKHATWLSERVEFDAVDEEEGALDLFEDEDFVLGCGPIVEKACLPLPAVPLGIGAFGRPRGDFK